MRGWGWKGVAPFPHGKLGPARGRVCVSAPFLNSHLGRCSLRAGLWLGSFFELIATHVQAITRKP